MWTTAGRRRRQEKVLSSTNNNTAIAATVRVPLVRIQSGRAGLLGLWRTHERGQTKKNEKKKIEENFQVHFFFYRTELLVFVCAPSISAPAAALHLHDAANTALVSSPTGKLPLPLLRTLSL